MEPDTKKNAIITMDVEFVGFSEKSLRTFLDLLGEYRFRATFFVSFDSVQRFPGVVDLLLRDGHEVASHGYSHPFTGKEIRRRMRLRNERELIAEIEASRKFLEKFGVQPMGIRLPAFQWDARTLEVISRHFRYDSSLTRGGAKGDLVLRNHHIQLPNGRELFELPVSCLPGTAFRLGTPYFLRLGGRLMTASIRLARMAPPLVFYAHSFDLTRLDISWMPVERWKKSWYFKHCGPERAAFFRTFFEFLRRDAFTVMRCMDYVKSVETSSPGGSVLHA